MLQSLPDVDKVLAVEPNVFDIECVSWADCRPGIARLVVAEDWGLLEMNAVNVSLEDIFLELTAEQAGVA
jgi:hypothetical protein